MSVKSKEDLVGQINMLRAQLDEANDTLEAIRTGQVDALVVNGGNGHSLYTLKSADHAYRIFIEQMTEGAVTLNTEGVIIYSNSQFAKLVETPLSKVLGRNFVEFIDPFNRQAFIKLFHIGWTKNVKFEVELKQESGTLSVQLSLNALALEGEDSLSIIVADLTGQKENESILRQKNDQLERLNEALINSNHDLQQFASVASHDLQEPLRKIQVYSKFLKDRSFNDLSDDSKIYVEKMITCAQRMKVLIVDILTYSRLSANESHLESVDLNQVTSEILEDFDLRISEKNAMVNVDNLCTVQGNKGQLRQVFYNLISNALKFTSPERPPVIEIKQEPLTARDLGVSLDNAEKFCRVIVKDNGIGFNEKFASLIFSLFEKLNPKTSFEGSGIGLAIAKKIIDKHHGLIIAKSVLGQGSEFNIILPFKQPSSK